MQKQLCLIQTNSAEIPEADSNVSSSDGASDRVSGLGDWQHQDRRPRPSWTASESRSKESPDRTSRGSRPDPRGRESKPRNFGVCLSPCCLLWWKCGGPQERLLKAIRSPRTCNEWPPPR